MIELFPNYVNHYVGFVEIADAAVQTERLYKVNITAICIENKGVLTYITQVLQEAEVAIIGPLKIRQIARWQEDVVFCPPTDDEWLIGCLMNLSRVNTALIHMTMECLLYEPCNSRALYTPGNSRPSTTVQAGVVGGMVCQGESGCVPLVSNVPPTRTQTKSKDIRLSTLFVPQRSSARWILACQSNFERKETWR